MLEFHATRDQCAELEGLAHWHAELCYCYERFPDDGGAIQQARRTISLLFDVLDAHGVPFWVQNNVLTWSEEWRNLKREDIGTAMRRKNIFLN